jgi:hypothetical protein
VNNPQPWWLTQPPAEVAATILPLFSQSANQQDVRARASIVNWVKTGSYESSVRDLRVAFNDPDQLAAAEALQVLEYARLLLRIFDGPDGISYLGLMRLGRNALQTNTVRQHLGLEGPA